jgi:hypothetical protein
MIGLNWNASCTPGERMSLLEFNLRPLVAFDVDLKEHRRLYNQFKRTRSWGHCPYRFIVPNLEQFDLVTSIEHLLLTYYMDREFGKPLPMGTARKDVQKMQKLVDKQPKGVYN